MLPDESNPFNDWSGLIHRQVYSSDGKKVGFLRAVVNDHIIVKRGLISLHKYIIPSGQARSVDSKKRVHLYLSLIEIRSQYSHFTFNSVAIPHVHLKHRPVHDRLQALRHGITRNRMAAIMALVAGVLFLLSGYKASIVTYELIEYQIKSIDTLRSVWYLIIVPLGALVILSQLSGLTVLGGAALYAKNRVNLGKFLVMIGTGQGLFVVLWNVYSDISSGDMSSLNRYATWLTSTAAGLGVVFAILSQSMSKGKDQSIAMKLIRIMFNIKKN